MAEEEILEETTSAPKKGSGGGFSVVHLAVILLAVVVTAVAGIMIGKAGSAGVVKEMEMRLKELRTTIEVNSNNEESLSEIKCRPLMGEKEEKEPCDGTKDDCNVVVKLGEEDTIVGLADGHFVSLHISVCLAPKHKAEVFEKSGQADMVLHVVNDFFAKKSMADFFPAKGTAQVAEPAPGEEDSMIEELESENQGRSYAQRKDALRTELRQELSKRGIDFVDDILVTKFIAQ